MQQLRNQGRMLTAGSVWLVLSLCDPGPHASGWYLPQWAGRSYINHQSLTVMSTGKSHLIISLSEVPCSQWTPGYIKLTVKTPQHMYTQKYIWIVW